MISVEALFETDMVGHEQIFKRYPHLTFCYIGVFFSSFVPTVAPGIFAFINFQASKYTMIIW